MEEISDEQFQFYKEKLQSAVKEYLELDDQITALKKATKERTETKKKLSSTILEHMKKLEINYMNIKDGAKLVYKVSESQKGINKKTLVDGLRNIFEENDEAITNALSIILDGREKVQKESLRLVKKRGPKGITLMEGSGDSEGAAAATTATAVTAATVATAADVS